MKDIKLFIIKLTISIIVLAIAFIFLEKKPPVTAIHFDVSKKETTPTPSKLKWYEPFKGVENVPSKPKIETK